MLLTKMLSNPTADSEVNVVTPLHKHDLENDLGVLGGNSCERKLTIPNLDNIVNKREIQLKSISKVNELATTDSFSISSSHFEKESDINELNKYSSILCDMKNEILSFEDCNDVADIVVEIFSERNDHGEASDLEYYEKEHMETGCNEMRKSQIKNLIFPNNYPKRLSIPEDADEVNQLHQYVRKDLLEIFVIPESYSSLHHCDTGDEDDRTTSSTESKDSRSGLNTRGSTNKHPTSSIPQCQAQKQRHYPGRVGLRCVYCANISRKSTTKSVFYPLRVKNIYREVCAWQRIHFKTCPLIPPCVREKYEQLKETDRTRGKVRFWESSARKIGLENNPNRDDGIIFMGNSWKR